MKFVESVLQNFGLKVADCNDVLLTIFLVCLYGSPCHEYISGGKKTGSEGNVARKGNPELREGQPRALGGSVWNETKG